MPRIQIALAVCDDSGRLFGPAPCSKGERLLAYRSGQDKNQSQNDKDQQDKNRKPQGEQRGSVGKGSDQQ